MSPLRDSQNKYTCVLSKRYVIPLDTEMQNKNLLQTNPEPPPKWIFLLRDGANKMSLLRQKIAGKPCESFPTFFEANGPTNLETTNRDIITPRFATLT